jgi:hypothetical protein
MSKPGEESGIHRFRFLLLLVALLLLLLAIALEPELRMWKFVASVLATAGTIAGLALVRRSRWVLWVATLLTVPALVAFFSIGERVGAGSHAPFFVFAAVVCLFSNVVTRPHDSSGLEGRRVARAGSQGRLHRCRWRARPTPRPILGEGVRDGSGPHIREAVPARLHHAVTLVSIRTAQIACRENPGFWRHR